MLIYLGCSAVFAFAMAIALAWAGAPPAAVAHAAFALGAMPLIFAAMGHFVPVLTRSGGAEARIHRLPLVMQLAGAAVVGVLAGVLPGAVLHGAVTVGLAAAGIFLAWLLNRGRATLGKPHPGLAWYGAALGCLILALLAILVGLLWPAGYGMLRLAHLHLNTLGFIGLTAIGTLHVLMPTVLGQPDPQVANRLRRQLPWALAGVGLTALAGGLPWLTPVGVVLIGGVVGQTLAGWLRTYGWTRLRGDGAALSLLGAGFGLLVVIVAGGVHGLGGMAGRLAVVGFFALFLLPLVAGALSQLLPVWRFPGPATPARAAMRRRLVRFGGLRTGFFLAGGALLFGGITAGVALLAAGVLLFAGVLIHSLVARP
ncbi:hypothetical protein ETQ85_20435 [Zoogloea oleivorans]|uniref:NnrS family protein n=1 Tax=Zoogloea oleivorans TaxID=1552750 RepID=A0A6C2CKJ7_9RHOO|nr:hypothetical protein [Zoogloea oleivorans]TYC53959.1 hypothetical protein ETQ85_20435 [Zoogloea oleivorans]